MTTTTRLRTAVAVSVAAMLLGTACGGPEDDREPDASGTRTVQTDEGAVEVPVEIDRVVTTHNIATQPLVDLGVQPVGIGSLDEASAYPEYWQKIKDIEQIANAQSETDVERVAALDPDVIFALNTASGGELEQLGKIAPVVQIGIDGPKRSQWRERAAVVADVVGRGDRLEELDEQYEDRAEEIAGTHADVLSAETFNVLDSFESGGLEPYSPSSMIGEVLEPAGARFAPSASSPDVIEVNDKSGGRTRTLSYEDLPELTDGSVVLHGSAAGDNAPSPAQQEMLDSPLFAASAAAQQGRVFPIGKTTIAGYGDALNTLRLFDQALTEIG